MLALAPMQDVTDLPFWNLIRAYGGADVYVTEYFRVHPTSNLEPWILRSITDNPTGRPVIAQMIGNDIPSLVRTARELQQYPIVAVDLNLGCPAPVVYRKCAGGGLLREPRRIDAILGALRDALSIRFTVKTRIGFDSPEVFDELLPIFAKQSLDLLAVHGRTVRSICWPCTGGPCGRCIAVKCIMTLSRGPSPNCRSRCWPTATSTRRETQTKYCD